MDKSRTDEMLKGLKPVHILRENIIRIKTSVCHLNWSEFNYKEKELCKGKVLF